MMANSSATKNVLTLCALALTATVLLYVVNKFTKDSIVKSEQDVKQKILLEVLPVDDSHLLTEIIKIPESAWADLGLKNGGDIYVARHPDETITLIIPAVAPDGYNGSIRMVVGVDANGNITGARVLEHHETPGMGDKIDLKKTPWILGFNGLSVQSPKLSQWKVKRDGGDFDQLAGATITSRAVVNQVRRVLEFVDAHRDELFTKNISAQ